MDYEKEVQILKSASSCFKPTAGSYKIVILSEPEETKFVDEKTHEETPQIKIAIEVDKERRMWFIGKSITYNGLYGQLMLIGQSKKKLTGEVITLLVKRSGDKNEYTVVEAVDLIKAATKK